MKNKQTKQSSPTVSRQETASGSRQKPKLSPEVKRELGEVICELDMLLGRIEDLGLAEGNEEEEATDYAMDYVQQALDHLRDMAERHQKQKVAA